MKKNMLFCFVFVFMSFISHNSVASVVTYYLDGDMIYDDLDGFITYESEGIIEPYELGYDGGNVDFKVYEFFLERDNDVLVHNINEANDNISFMVNGITDSSLVYGGDRDYGVTTVYGDYIYFSWISEVPEDGSRIFAPNAFDMWYFTSPYGPWSFAEGTIHAMSTVSAVDEPVHAMSTVSAVDEQVYAMSTVSAVDEQVYAMSTVPAVGEPVYAMPSISEVDEPSVFTLVLYGLLSVCLIAVIKRVNVIKC